MARQASTESVSRVAFILYLAVKAVEVLKGAIFTSEWIVKSNKWVGLVDSRIYIRCIDWWTGQCVTVQCIVLFSNAY